MGKIRKKDSSDEEEEGEKKPESEEKSARSAGRRKSAESEEEDAPKPAPKSRGRMRRADDDDEDDDDDEMEMPDWRKKKQQQEAAMSEIKAKKGAPSEIEPADEPVTPPPGQPETPGTLARRGKGRTRFDRASQDEQEEDGGARLPIESMELYAPNPEEIPWTTDEERRKREERTFFRVGEKGKNALKEARDGMREQGLYVARDRVLLPSNIERAIQRVRHRKEAVKEREKAVEEEAKEAAKTVVTGEKKEGEHEGEEGEGDEEAKRKEKERKEKEEEERKQKEEEEEKRKEKEKEEERKRKETEAKAKLIDARTGLEFEADEEPYLVPFDPLKDRICRPAQRYDPSAPYMQYDMVVPVQNIDAVLGSPDSSVLLELEVARVDLIDHPLFSREDYLAVELQQLARKYQRRAEMNWVDLCTQKLEALQSALETVQRERELAKEQGGRNMPLSRDKAKGSKRMIEALIGHGGAVEKLMQEQYLQEEVRHLRLQRAQEEFEDLAIVSRMIQVWEQVKKVRAEQGFTSTRVELKFREKKTNRQQDIAEREAELQAELAEMRKRHQAAFDAQQAKFIKDKATLEEKVDALHRKIADLEEKEAQAKLGEPVDDDDDEDDEEEDELDDDEAYSSYSPTKKHGKALKPSDGKLALQLALQKDAEKETLTKTKELLERLVRDKTPNAADNPFDATAAREEIEERQQKMKRPAGDPIYIPILRDDKSKTGDNESAIPRAERRRREQIRNLKLLLRVSVNGRMLRKVDGRVLEVELVARSGFEFSFKAKETIQLAPTSGLPEIEIHVVQGGLLHSEIASLFVPVGEEGLSERGDPLVFQSRMPFQLDPAAQAVTKELRHADSDEKVVLPSGEHYITGQVFLRFSHTNTAAAATTTQDGAVAVNVDLLSGDGAKGPRKEQRGGMVSSAKLKKMIQMNQLDPNDPRNRHLLELLSANKEAESDAYVRFDPLLDTLLMGEQVLLSQRDKDYTVLSNRWIGTQDLTRPAGMRHKLLMARDANPGSFSGEWPDNAIPVLDHEIDADEVRQDEFYQKVVAVEFPEDDEETERAVDNKQVKRLLQFKQKVQDVVRKHKAKQGQRVRRVYRLEDVVHQPELPTFGAPDIIEAIRYFFRKRSALRPEEKPVKVTSANPSECRISITVQRAQNLPQRRPEIPAPGQPGYVSASTPGQQPTQPEIGAPLECVVQARFGRSIESTPVFKGNNPAWNAHLNLKFEPPNKSWSPSNLMKVGEYLHLNIFDTKVWKKPDLDGQVTKLEKRWLGSIRFPFTTLYTASARGRIEGVFEIDAPPHIIGYTTAHNQHQEEAAQAQAGGKKKKESAAPPTKGPTVPGTSHLKPTLQICVALDPPLAQPSQREKELKGRLQGQPELDARIREWIAECSRPSHCRDRTFDAAGRSLNRDYILATRFVTKEAPPELEESEAASDERKMAQLCRYVSLIPFLEDFHLEDAGGDEVDHEGMDVWCTSAEFVHFMAGDWEEHATLLCNFFLHMNQKAYIVFGSGIPEGDTVYVMTVDKEEQVWFWNASRGCKYHSKDDKCTLKEVFYVVNNENVWGNVQVTKDLTESSFNLKDIKCWRPLFNEKYPASKFQTDTVQEKIDWKLNQKNEAFVRDVQKEISLGIRNRLEHWRSREGKSLVENEAANRTLTDILKAMERSAHNGTVFTEADHHHKLSKFLQPGATSGFNMTGFYINRPYTDPQQIIDEIENADIHHAGPVVVESDMQFAHAVYVRAFPRRVLSLWVAVACLSRKR